jgi:hypothetical protein
MTQPTEKTKTKAKAEASTEVLPSHAHARAGKTDEAPLTDAEVSAANAAYQVRFKRVDDLVAYVRNSRTHSDAQVAQLAASMVEFGFVGAILADEKGIVAGHGRVMAARHLYAAGKRLKSPNGAVIPAGCVPFVDCTGWSEAQRKAFVIWDNRSAELAGWNRDMLRIEFDDLAALDFNLDLTGFDSGAIDAMFKGDDAEEGGAGGDEPAVDEPEAPTVIQCPSCQHQFSVLKEVDAKKPAKRRKAA